MDDILTKDLEITFYRMHMHNIELGKEGSPKFESRFGFNIETCCGSIPQSNNWDSSWTVRACFVITSN